MAFNTGKIGVIDSGLGGLFTLKNLMAALPGRDFIYLADTAYLPYGEKTKEQLADRLQKVLGFFESQPVTAVVVACNTLSAVVLSERPKTKFRLFNVVNPAILQILPEDNVVGVVATEYTVKSGVFAGQIAGLGKKPLEVACPKLVELIEAGRDIVEVKKAFFEYLSRFESQPDCLILGCTHYGLLSGYVPDFWPDTRVIDTNYSVVGEARRVLPGGSGGGAVEFFVTGSPEKFKAVAMQLFGAVPFLRGSLNKASLN